jgi:signal transduction histidine kinase
LHRELDTLAALPRILPDWLLLLGKDGVVLDCRSPVEAEIDGAERLIGLRLADVLSPAKLEIATGFLSKALATGRIQVFSFQQVIAGATHEFQVRALACGPDQVLAVARDVTERRAMAKEILEISNREQMRIGQDLHDSLGQHLTGITFLARALENKLSVRELPEAAEAAEIGRLVLQALSQTRNLARGLFPAELEGGGLVLALQDLAATVEKCFRVSCAFSSDGTEVRARTMAHHLLRIAQEAVSNAIRHGKAKQVLLDLRTIQGRIVLEVRDTGIGMSPKSPSATGLGLRIMNYRAQKLRATLEIVPAEPAGTVVRCACEPVIPEELAA